MLHELLLALSGTSGDIFVPIHENQQQQNTSMDPTNNLCKRIKALKIPVDLPLLHGSERIALEKVALLGLIYSQIKQITSYTVASSSSNTVTSISENEYCFLANSTFAKTLCGSIDHVLDEYTQLIVQVEGKVLDTLDLDTSGIHTPLSSIIHLFSEVTSSLFFWGEVRKVHD